MANWKKVIVSGSSAQLSQLSVDTSITLSGSLNSTGSVFLKGLENGSQANIVGFDTLTGQLFYQGTGSFSANSASYALTASYVNPLTQSVSILGDLIVTGSAGITGSLSATGSFNVAGPSTLTGSLTIAGDTQISSSLGVTGSSVVTGSFGVTGSSSITGSLNVAGATTITGSLSIAADTQISGSLGITGSTTFTGSFGVTGSSSFTGSFNVAGPSTVTGSLSVAGDTQISGSLGLTGSFSVLGGVQLTGSFTGSFFGDGAGLTNIPASSISGLSTSAIASGSATASISPNGGLQVNTNTTITGSLTVSGSAGSSFDINADTFVFTGSLSTTGSVQLAGLTNATKPNIVGFDVATGQLYYQGTGSYATLGANTFTGDQTINKSNASLNLSGGGSFGTINFHGFNASIFDYVGQNHLRLQASSQISNKTNNFVVLDSNDVVKVNITGSSIQLSGSVGALNGFSGSFSGSFQGDGSGLTGVVATAGFALSEGAGITDFSYDGGTSGITVAVSGASTLSSNIVTKWTGDAFANSSITDSTLVTINNSGGVLVQQGGLYVTGASTFHDNVIFQGDITVQGTASFQNATDLAIADQFILLNSGSATFQDSGIIINTGNASNSGSAWFLETAGTTTGTDALNGRFAVGSGVLPNATSVTAAEYANTTKIVAIDPTTEVPQFGGSGLGQGNMWVNTENGEIFIYA